MVLENGVYNYHNDAMVKTVETTITILDSGHFGVPNVSSNSIINIEVLNYYYPVCLTSHGNSWRIMDIGLSKYPTCVAKGTTIKVKVWYI